MNTYLETGIAIVLIILFFSIIVYVIQELIAANLRFRGKMLEASIRQILEGTNDDEKLANRLLQHPQVKMLNEQLAKMPSYIPAANFAMAVMDIVALKAPHVTNDLFTDYKNGCEAFVNGRGDIPVLLKSWVSNSKNVIELKAAIEKWFNEYMDRVSGWYKRKYRWITRIIAVIVAFSFNLDLIRISKTIYSDSILRTSLVNIAEKTVDQPEIIKRYYESSIESSLSDLEKRDTILKNDTLLNKTEIDSLRKIVKHQKDSILVNYSKQQILLIRSLADSVNIRGVLGWPTKPWYKIESDNSIKEKNGGEIVYMLLGLLIGAAFISMGAPFWFELLVKLVNIRRTGVKPKETNK